MEDVDLDLLALDGPDARPSVFIDDAARILGVSRRTIYHMIADGRLQAVTVAAGTRRITRASLEAQQRRQSCGHDEKR